MTTVKQPHHGTNGFKRVLIAWTLVLTLGTGYALWSARAVSHREVVSCADPRGDLALRLQWQRVAELIRRTNLKPSNPEYLGPKEAGKQFARSYQDALREAGPAPNCLGRNGP